MAHPATKKRGGDPDVKHRERAHTPGSPAVSPAERELEEGLEESMAGSDAVSVIQPAPRERGRRNPVRPRSR